MLVEAAVSHFLTNLCHITLLIKPILKHNIVGKGIRHLGGKLSKEGDSIPDTIDEEHQSVEPQSQSFRSGLLDPALDLQLASAEQNLRQRVKASNRTTLLTAFKDLRSIREL